MNTQPGRLPGGFDSALPPTVPHYFYTPAPPGTGPLPGVLRPVCRFPGCIRKAQSLLRWQTADPFIASLPFLPFHGLLSFLLHMRDLLLFSLYRICCPDALNFIYSFLWISLWSCGTQKTQWSSKWRRVIYSTFVLRHCPPLSVTGWGVVDTVWFITGPLGMQ